jgi:hypothetical protein
MMQFAIWRSHANAAELSPVKTFEQSGFRWLKFGNDYFCYTTDLSKPADWSNIESVGARLKASEPAADPARPTSLYLVIQEGRTFQHAHPDVPVLFDKGRHLLVGLDQRRADSIASHDARFLVRPVTENETILETLEKPKRAPRESRRIQELVGAVSRPGFEVTLRKLASYPTRHSLTTHYQDAASYVRDQLLWMGYDVGLEKVTMKGGSTLNVIAEKRGIGNGRRQLTLVTAHLDSINHPNAGKPEDPGAPAPGADDNGSGSAGVIEIARVLKDQPTVHDLRLILFGGEEEGLFGSKSHVKHLPTDERMRIQAVVNMDMIGVLNGAIPTVLLEGGKGVSEGMIGGLALAAHTYTGLTVKTSLNPYNSDHYPFITAGIPAVLTIEGDDDSNHNVHNANDTLDRIDYSLAMEILRMNTAYVAGSIGL